MKCFYIVYICKDVLPIECFQQDSREVETSLRLKLEMIFNFILQNIRKHMSWTDSTAWKKLLNSFGFNWYTRGVSSIDSKIRTISYGIIKSFAGKDSTVASIWIDHSYNLKCKIKLKKLIYLYSIANSITGTYTSATFPFGWWHFGDFLLVVSKVRIILYRIIISNTNIYCLIAFMHLNGHT